MINKVNVLLVDDQPEKLLAYEVILNDLNENLVKTSSASEALAFLLKNDVAVVLIDVCMPELDGFQLAAMIREHPRFQKTAIIFISAIQVTEMDRLREFLDDYWTDSLQRLQHLAESAEREKGTTDG